MWDRPFNSEGPKSLYSVSINQYYLRYEGTHVPSWSEMVTYAISRVCKVGDSARGIVGGRIIILDERLRV